ncbi:indolepyruvate ferredoxin oxidoreductase family protein [Azospirillum melinis]|uniref:Indolepyruvate ferredoxin oxidoreductase family protein n=1 Tax=Azospirillum melinis TaxID=328839 RepID=A0ABX2KAD7_9PROT|nr:indolepyruvate ferredoxin oxidoreductase family protein [Azospirillum melinis]MBP2306805.1 indolepyruvate ferredoxin oxidoreductase [Azospirillum melinis]NUA98687.1 indolepyruvate ferredoxin oxidoreductase family protein [Azospirillum melinis]
MDGMQPGLRGGLRPEQAEIDRSYRLDDRYCRTEGQVYLSGTQALVRLLLLQAESDRRAGLNTAGFVSGYRGSPLGGLDQALWQARKHLDTHAIRFVPGVNEDLGATAVMGTQQVESSGEGTVDGVFGMWYGKGPGVDRSGDVLKHANAYGSSPRGGVLAVAGDDHGCVSSSMPHQSDLAMIAWSMPVLNPSGVREYLDFGLYGYALSRFSGAWIGFKAISESVESSATVRLPSLERGFLPVAFDPPPGGLHYRWPDLPSLAIEERLAAKVAAVKAFARVNRIDRSVLGTGGWLRIVTTGKAHLDLMEALRLLGIGPAEAAEIGLSVHKIGLSWPLEPDFALTAARGAEEILVVEEKAPVVEGQLKDLLFHLPAGERPRAVVGKTDEFGAPLLPATGELRPWIVAKALVERIRHRFPQRDFSGRLAELLPGEAPAAPALPRTPYFCSGCPHNSSTRVPDGSKAMAGIGCHFMASWMDRDTVGLSQMGGEGVSWIGQAPFSKRPHIFQNLGEGTYFHSGLLAIRQAVAARINITYKILFNDAVAMTGGQPVDGPISVDAITRQLAAEGITRIAVVSDAPEKYDSRSGLAPFTTVHHREELDAVQREMREISGVTAIVYEQTCAAEKRRRRKRGTMTDPARRMVINDLVCEGCGDCGKKSNCLSVQPKQTEFGVKRQIDQSSCNKDYSCADGFCPSFVSVVGGSLRKPDPDSVAARFADDLAALPLPQLAASDDPAEILIVGVGGTGIVTIGAVLAMAAHLEGKASSVLDFMGFAQKGGAVYSYLRVAEDAGRLNQARIDPKQAQLVLACDTVVAASPDALKTVRLGRTRVVANAHVAPTGAFTRDGSKLPDAGSLLRSLRRAAGPDRVEVVDANRVVTALFGDSILANVFLMGVAFQKGLLPVGLEALTRAIELNGTGVPANLRAFAFGRLAAHRPELLATLGAEEQAPATDLAAIVERRAAFLTDYQDRAYADRYRALVERARQAEARAAPGSTALAEAVARSAFKLMAYKDEYEVARLHSDPSFRKSLEERFEGDWKPVFHLAPPLLSRDTNGHGEPRKMALGGWILPVFRGLAAMKKLRGTALDPFGYTAERKMERALVTRFEATVAEIAERLSADRLATAVELAALPQEIRGFGPVKHRAMEAVEPRWRALEQRLRERAAQAA